MPATTNSKIDISLSSKKYKLFGNRSFFVLTIKSKNDKNFHYQMASIVHNNQTLDLEKLKEKLKNSLYFAGITKRLIFSKKEDFLKFLIELNFNRLATKIIQIKGNNEHCFIFNKDQAKAQQEYDINLSRVYIIDTFQRNNDISHLAILKPIDVNNNPEFSIVILTTDKEKITTSLFSLSDNQELFNNAKILDTDKLVQNLPIISKEIIRLANDSRDSAREKIKIFIAIFNMIRENKPQQVIIAKLDEVKPVLSEHRNPLSYFFNNFIKKIETRSEHTLEILRSLLLAQKEAQSAEINFHH